MVGDLGDEGGVEGDNDDGGDHEALGGQAPLAAHVAGAVGNDDAGRGLLRPRPAVLHPTPRVPEVTLHEDLPCTKSDRCSRLSSDCGSSKEGTIEGIPRPYLKLHSIGGALHFGIAQQPVVDFQAGHLKSHDFHAHSIQTSRFIGVSSSRAIICSHCWADLAGRMGLLYSP